jgi:transposase ISL3 family protein
MALWWIKFRWKCDEPGCDRKTFTEWLPQVPPRCRLTARLREQAAAEVADRGITRAEAAQHAGISWPAAHDAFTARRRVVRGKYGRRGRSGDPEYGIKSLLARNLEHLSPAQFTKITSALQADPAGQEIAAAWIGKENSATR